MLDRLKRRWRALFRKNELEHELEAELRFHLEREAEQNLRNGIARMMLKDVSLLQLQARRILGPLSQTLKRRNCVSDDQIEV